MTSEHTAVLVEEALAALALEAGGYYVDATFGRGRPHGTHYSRPWVEKAACSRSTGTRKPSRPGASALPTKCGLRSSTRRLPISPSLVPAHGARPRVPRRALRPRRLIAAARRPDPRLQLPRRRSARYAYGSDTRRAGLCLARSGGRRRDSRGDRRLGEERFARRVAQNAIARRAPRATARAHRTARGARGTRGAHARAGQESGDPHLPGAAHVHQR
jgi:hypothetical protein